jgi:hypothetical protein
MAGTLVYTPTSLGVSYALRGGEIWYLEKYTTYPEFIMLGGENTYLHWILELEKDYNMVILGWEGQALGHIGHGGWFLLQLESYVQQYP